MVVSAKHCHNWHIKVPWGCFRFLLCRLCTQIPQLNKHGALPQHKHQLHGADTSSSLNTSTHLGVETAKNIPCPVITISCLIKNTLSWPKSCQRLFKLHKSMEFQGSKAPSDGCFITTQIKPTITIFPGKHFKLLFFYSISSACCINGC